MNFLRVSRGGATFRIRSASGIAEALSVTWQDRSSLGHCSFAQPVSCRFDTTTSRGSAPSMEPARPVSRKVEYFAQPRSSASSSRMTSAANRIAMSRCATLIVDRLCR